MKVDFYQEDGRLVVCLIGSVLGERELLKRSTMQRSTDREVRLMWLGC